MTLRKAVVIDAKSIKKLIDYWAGEQLMLPRSLSEIYEYIRDFWVWEEEGLVTGCARLHISWEDLAEVKSLAVNREHLRRGIGNKLLLACLSEAKQLGVKKVFALTYAREFFGKQGFVLIDKADLPHKIWNECLKCPKFSDCDETAMLYEFDRK